jgi:predicted glycoside hydrolase/deacetylase ChbG (UPF0249 family)
MDTISLIVRADDFGLCHAANQAIEEGFEAGLLTCASLAIACPWVAEAVALARAHPEWEIGLQLVLTCPVAGCRWGPVAGPTAVPSLTDATGAFAAHLSAAAWAEEIGREWEAQIERTRAWGIAPAYLEYVGEVHPDLDRILQQMSERHGLPARLAAWGVQPLPAMDGGEEAVREALTALTPGTYLWVTRPAHDSPETWGLWPEGDTAGQRDADARAVCSAAVAAVVRERGIETISFRQHVEARLGPDAESD